MSLNIVNAEEFEVFQDEPSPPEASAPSLPPASEQQRAPLGDRTQEYWGGYYRPLVCVWGGAVVKWLVHCLLARCSRSQTRCLEWYAT